MAAPIRARVVQDPVGGQRADAGRCGGGTPSGVGVAMLICPAMNGENKRSTSLPVESVQQGNKQWWTDHTMSYDWHNEIEAPRFSAAWYEAIDRRAFTATISSRSTASFHSIAWRAPTSWRSAAEWDSTPS
jgi:hypothetical protein